MRYITFLLFLPMIIFGQEIKLETQYGSNNKEISEILLFEGLDKREVKFVSNELKNKHFKIFVKHIWDGKITKTETLIDTYKDYKQSIINDDTLHFSVLAKKFSQNQLKVMFNFKPFSIHKMYDATESSEYSFRILADKNIKIEFGKPFPLFAYILPYEKDGWKLYCAVDSSGKNVENWGKEFGIKHYIIYEMIFDK